MGTLLISACWFCAYGVFYAFSAGVDFPNPASAKLTMEDCDIADLGQLYTATQIREILIVTERGVTSETAELYVKVIGEFKPNKVPKTEVQTGKPTSTLMKPKNIKPRTAHIVEQLEALYYPLLHVEDKPTSCDVKSIVDDMLTYNEDRIIDDNACLTGTNLRKLEHLSIIVARASDKPDDSISKILVFFLPELKTCWNTVDKSQLSNIVLRMQRGASELRLRQNAKYFSSDRLNQQHVVKYFPNDERKCISDGHPVGTRMFHSLIEYFERHCMRDGDEGLFRVGGALNDPKINELLYAVVLNVGTVESIMQGQETLPKYAKKVVDVIRVFLRVSKFEVTADELKVALKAEEADVTQHFVRLIHNARRDHVCIEAMLAEIMRVSVAATRQIEALTIDNICRTPLASMFSAITLEDQRLAIEFCTKLMEQFDEATIVRHFTSHGANEVDSKPKKWLRLPSSPFRRGSASAAASNAYEDKTDHMRRNTDAAILSVDDDVAANRKHGSSAVASMPTQHDDSTTQSEPLDEPAKVGELVTAESIGAAGSDADYVAAIDSYVNGENVAQQAAPTAESSRKSVHQLVKTFQPKSADENEHGHVARPKAATAESARESVHKLVQVFEPRFHEREQSPGRRLRKDVSL